MLAFMHISEHTNIDLYSVKNGKRGKGYFLGYSTWCKFAYI